MWKFSVKFVSELQIHNLRICQVFSLKMAQPQPLFVYFRSFQTNNTIFIINQREKMSCPSSIQRQDLNP